jgi:hypothetical protein
MTEPVIEKDPLYLDLDIPAAPKAAPQPVIIAPEQDPVPVTLERASVPVPVAKSENLTLPPTTTAADDKVTEAQRRTSLLWESTQAAISVSITLAVIYCAVTQINSETITNAFFFIIATYFTRTNHTRIGGIGPKTNETYQGR